MVSNASDDLPEPESPVNTVRLSRGIFTSIFCRLFSLALSSLKKTGKLVAAEEVCAAGCLGSRLLSQACEEGLALNGARLLNLGKGIVAHGDRKLLMRDHGIDAGSIAKAAEELCKRKKL